MDSAFIWLRLSEKMKRGQALRRVVRLPLAAPPVQGHPSALPALASLGRAYLAARTQLCEQELGVDTLTSGSLRLHG